MISGFIRNLVRCFWWLALTLVAIVATVWAVIEHYLNAANGLELAGTETKPLREDSLIGPVFEAFIPEATLPQAMALTIAVVEALGLFMMAHWLLKILELARPWRDGRRSGDQAKVREAIWQIGETSLLFAVLSGVLIWGIWWDLEIFRYRSMAGADGLDNAATAAATLPSWALQLQEYGGWAAIQLVKAGAWGYLSFTAVGCIMVELCLDRLDDAFARLMQPFDQIWEDWRSRRTEEAQADVFYGYDQEGQPVYDPAAPIAYNTEGQPVEEQLAAEAAPETRAETEAHSRFSNGSDVHREGASAPVPEMATVHADRAAAHAAHNGNGTGHNGAASSPLFDPAEAARPLSQPGRPVTASRGSEPHDLREVLGGQPGQQVSLAEATAHPERYYVSLATGQVWMREAWERLHAVQPDTAEEER